MLKECWPDYMPEHLQFFSARSLSVLLERHSFSVTHTSTSSSSWHWLGGILRRMRRSAKGTEQSSESCARGMPGRARMRVLKCGDWCLSPLLMLEGAAKAGGELQVIARLNQ